MFIYTLYNEMFEGNDPADMDLLQLLKSRAPDPVKKALFDELYSDILLIFDLAPHDPGFTPEKISRMAKYFVESSDTAIWGTIRHVLKNGLLISGSLEI